MSEDEPPSAPLIVSQASRHDDVMRRGLRIDRTLHRWPVHGAWERAQRLIDNLAPEGEDA